MAEQKTKIKKPKSLAGEKPLFATIQTKSGVTKKVFNTNDTTEMLQPIPSPIVQAKLDDVLDAVKQLDTTCDYTKCKAKTTLMYQDCSFCKHRYCFKHGLPEVHGCGEAIKKLERDQFLHPVPQKTLQKQEDLKKAHTKMEQKLKEMSLARKAKPAAQKTKKKS